MRKIERQLFHAFWSDVTEYIRAIGNSTVTYDSMEHKKRLTLFGNPIAERSIRTSKVRFTLAGWDTATTRSRLRNVCRIPVWQEKSVPKVVNTHTRGNVEIEIEPSLSYVYDTVTGEIL